MAEQHLNGSEIFVVDDDELTSAAGAGAPGMVNAGLVLRTASQD